MEYNRETPDTSDDDAFKKAFKYFKQKASLPSFDSVIDINNPKKLQGNTTLETLNSDDGDTCTIQWNMQPSSKWVVHSINSVPGLYSISNVFSADHQRYWCQECVERYCRSPYTTNLDLFKPKAEVDAIWDESKQMISGYKKTDLKLLKNTPIWKLRWSTLGYHYGWDDKQYSQKNKSIFPDEISKMCSYISASLGFSEFTPEAAIVNFYHAGSTISPHVDISEADLQCPLLSISFGLPAIFLIGGDTRQTEPTALLVRSGQVLVMSGKSRTAYHAVPRVMASEAHKSMQHKDALSEYLQHSRINMNVRQVESAHFPLAN